MMIKIFAKELIKDMQFFKKIRKLDKDIQNYYIVKKIDFINEYYYEDKEIEFPNDEYVQSQRQQTTLENANNALMENRYLDSFYEICDFVEDYNNRKNEALYKEEIESIMFVLLSIRRKILLELDMDVTKNKILDSMSEKSEMNFIMVKKTIGEDQYARELELHEDIIDLKWYGKSYSFNDKNLVESLKILIMSYKDAILEIGAKAEAEKVSFTGRGVHFFAGNIDYLTFHQKSYDCKDRLFYDTFENAVFDLIDGYLKNM